MINRRLTQEGYTYISLRNLAAPLFRRKRTLIVTFAAVFIGVIMTGALAPPHFTSHMAILVNRERLDPLVTTEKATEMPADRATAVTLEEINSEMELLQSSDVLEKVVLASGLDRRQSFSPLGLLRRDQSGAVRVARAVQNLAKDLKVENKANSNLIDVTYSSPDPHLSHTVLSSLNSFYLEKHAEVHRLPGSLEFFAQQTQKYRLALEESEARLRSFGKEAGGAAPDLERSNLAVQVANSVGQQYSTEQAIAADEQRVRSDQEQLKITPQRSATKQDTNAASLLLEQLGSALLAAQTKRMQLGMKYDSSYPLVQEADQEVAETKAAIARAETTPYIDQETDRDPTFELLREDLMRTEVSLAARRASLTAIKRSIQNMEAEMGDLNQKAIIQQDLLRDVKANEDDYLLNRSKRQQEQMSDALDQTAIANVSVAVPPNEPVLPVYGFRSILLIAFAAACVLSAGAAYTVDALDSSFHTPAQVADMLGIPIVVAMPKKAA
jgi:succinoglycan biosynthesis transport protein ExoP